MKRSELERSLAEAQRLLERGPVEPRQSPLGPFSRRLRRVVLRLIRPYTAHSDQVMEALTRAVGSLERDSVDRYADVAGDLGRSVAEQRARVAQLAEANATRARDIEELRTWLRSLQEEGHAPGSSPPELAAGVAALRERLDRIAPDAEWLAAGQRATAYTAPGTLRSWDEPGAGSVLGFTAEDTAGAPASEAYREFAEVFRGPEERIRERQEPYLPLLRDHGPVVDVGCGRGELLDLLAAAGIPGRGVDSDPAMVERCQAKGLEVEEADGVEFLERLEPGSVGVVFSAQLVEHLPLPALQRYLAAARRALRPDGLMIAETVNPYAPHALKAFWIDPTHQHPLFPESLLVLARMAGFPAAYVFHPNGTGDVAVDMANESEYAIVARAGSAAA